MTATCALALLGLAFLVALTLRPDLHQRTPHRAGDTVDTREAVDPPTAAPLVLDQLIQVLDTNGTWHAATVGAGVLCSTVSDAARSSNVTEGFDPTTTVQWDYGVDHVDCPETACWSALGRA